MGSARRCAEGSPQAAACPVICPPELFHFRVGPRVALTFGVLWGLCRGRPGSLRISSAAVAGVLCCDARCIREAIETLVAVGLVERADHTGLVYCLRVNDPRSLAVARRIIADDGQASLFDSTTVEAAEKPAQEFPPLMLHEDKYPNSWSMPAAEKPAPKIPRGGDVVSLASALAERESRGAAAGVGGVGCGGAAAGVGGVGYGGAGVVVHGAQGLAAELRRRVADPDAAPQLFDDVAAAIRAGKVEFGRVKGLIQEIDEGSRAGRVRRRGAVFRAEFRKMLGMNTPPVP